MATVFLQNKFKTLGARLLVEDAPSVRFSIDVQHDGQGEFFKIRKHPQQDLENIVVVDLRPEMRHLLLLVKQDDGKQKFLCGHDERHWFVAAVPETSGVASVDSAMEALKPAPVQLAQTRQKLNAKERRMRKTRAYMRQGEWFFIPAPELKVSAAWVRINEPLRRSVASKPHVAQFCVRLRGETVYVCDQCPAGLRESDYKRLLERDIRTRIWKWEVAQRNARVYVKGRVRHPDHKTITLAGWHRVIMNTENPSRAMRGVAFLD